MPARCQRLLGEDDVLKPPALFHGYMDGPALAALTAAGLFAVWFATSKPVGRAVSLMVETAWRYMSNTRG